MVHYFSIIRNLQAFEEGQLKKRKKKKLNEITTLQPEKVAIKIGFITEYFLK